MKTIVNTAFGGSLALWIAGLYEPEALMVAFAVVIFVLVNLASNWFRLKMRQKRIEQALEEVEKIADGGDEVSFAGILAFLTVLHTENKP